ncbi:MAG: UDP-N-acetylmuramoyl-L-alanine--D-glutamate ligase [Marinilabiliales bacterium]|nr:MAG: UDP-N-acetylmuramoyl-L-alanine--D-glutamate ligase [Marinilabiliales bacterium]
MIEFLKSTLGGKKVLILGFGREGKSSLNFLVNNINDIEIGIADSDPELINDPLISGFDNSQLFFGDDYLRSINEYEFVFKSPGVKLSSGMLDSGIEISSQTSLFLDFYHKQTIGVSGTKGKSTTCSLIYFLLSKNHKKTVLLGNIGKPAFDFIDKIDQETIIVYELSAHQLENIKTSPDIAVLLNIFPEHLDYFTSFESYRNAKLNLLKYQNENSYSIVSEDIEIENGIEKNIQYFGYKENNYAFLKDYTIIIGKEDPKVYNCINLQIKGRHNMLNVMAAILALEFKGLSAEDSFKYLNEFEPLHHRLEFVGNFSGVNFYNDSISTIPESTIEAIKTIGKVDILLLGGFDRGLEYGYLAKFLINQQIKTFVFFGKAGKRIFGMLSGLGVDKNKLFMASDMEGAFRIISENAFENSICLLSPAASSYDQYKNFEHRGDAFKKLASGFSRG